MQKASYPPMLYSLRWVLPLSYILIAGVVLVSMRILLFWVLQENYQRQERLHLHENALAVQPLIEASIQHNPDQVHNQLVMVGALIDARVQMFDIHNELLIDSGSPEGTLVDFGRVQLPPAPMTSLGGQSDTLLDESATPVRIFPVEPVGYTLAEVERVDARSNQEVQVELVGEGGQSLGLLHLSEGPSQGAPVLANVSRGWTVASSVTVVLAALLGWWVSESLSRPLVKLTRATQRMKRGELSTRVSINRRDELGQLARHFNEMATRIEQSMMIMQQFLADAAHEIHTPLTALRTNIEIIGEASPSAASTRAQDQVIRLTELTDNLLDLSRIEHNEVAHEPLALRPLIVSISEVYASRAEQHGIDFKMKVPKDEDAVVRGHRLQLQRVIGNLLDNAIKFTPEGGTVACVLHLTEKHAHIVVQDSGIGLNPDDIPMLFNRFYRAKNAVEFKGSGLGLAIAKAIIDTHNGKITAKSLDKGSRFVISLHRETASSKLKARNVR